MWQNDVLYNTHAIRVHGNKCLDRNGKSKRLAFVRAYGQLLMIPRAADGWVQMAEFEKWLNYGECERVTRNHENENDADAERKLHGYAKN